MSSSQFRRGKRRFDDDESTFLKRDRHRRRLPPADFGSETFGLPEGDRWSTWDQSAPTERGPQPHPDWLVTDLAAVDTELGILKTGKEAGVFLLRRGVPGTDRSRHGGPVGGRPGDDRRGVGRTRRHGWASRGLGGPQRPLVNRCMSSAAAGRRVPGRRRWPGRAPGCGRRRRARGRWRCRAAAPPARRPRRPARPPARPSRRR